MPAHLKFKKHMSWSAEDSKREMSKWVSHTPPTDPAVEAIQKALEANLTYFMANVATLCDKYNNELGEVLQNNPKAKEALTVPEPATKTSPLLQRQASTVTLDEHAAAVEAKKATKGGAVTVRLPKVKIPGAAAAAAATGETDAAKATGDDAKDKTEAAGATAACPKIIETESGDRKAVIKKVKLTAEEAAKVEEEMDDDDDSDDSSTYDPSPDAPPVEFPDNTELLKRLRIIKREAYELGTTFDGIHDWIALNIPAVSEDDNEGAAVMGAVLEQVTSLSGTVRDVYGQESSYLDERSEMECTIIKYPDSATLRQTLEVVDNNTWDDLDRNWRALLRSTLILYTTLHKNMAKLREPKRAMQTHMMM